MLNFVEYLGEKLCVVGFDAEHLDSTAIPLNTYDSCILSSQTTIIFQNRLKLNFHSIYKRIILTLTEYPIQNNQKKI